MSVLILDNSRNRVLLREGEWVGRILGRLGRQFEARSGPHDRPDLDPARHTHLILTGSESSVLDEEPWMEHQIELVRQAAGIGLPTLGICFGHQLIARAMLGAAAVSRAPRPEFGWLLIEVLKPDGLLNGLGGRFVCLSTHYDQVNDAGGQFDVTAKSAECAIQAMSHRGLPIHGIQFHPEIPSTEAKLLLAAAKAMDPRLDLDLGATLTTAAMQDPRLGERILANFLGTDSRGDARVRP